MTKGVRPGVVSSLVMNESSSTTCPFIAAAKVAFVSQEKTTRSVRSLPFFSSTAAVPKTFCRAAIIASDGPLPNAGTMNSPDNKLAPSIVVNMGGNRIGNSPCK